MKILLLNPPFLPRFSRFSRSPAVTKSGTIYFPIWHAYAAGTLEQAGHEIKLLDAAAEGLDREACFRIAQDFQPDMIVTYTSTPSIYNDVEIAGMLADLLPESFAILTGPHVSALPEETLRLDTRVDAVARQEYDLTLLELAQALPQSKDLNMIKGLTFRNGESIVTTPDREFITDLDAFPFVSAVYKKH